MFVVVASIPSAVACVRLVVVVVVVAPAEVEALFDASSDVEVSSSHLRTRSEEAHHPLLLLRIAAQPPPLRADVVVELVVVVALALLVPLACCFDSSGLSVPESSSFRFGDGLTALMMLVARQQQQRRRYSRIARETATLPWTEYSLLLLVVVAVRAKRRLCLRRRRRLVRQQREIVFAGRTGLLRHHLSRRSPSLFSWTLREMI